MSIFRPTGTSQALIKAVRPHIKGGKLLDLGCGSGIIGSQFSSCSVYASDIDLYAVEFTKHYYPDIETRQGSLFEPWKDMKFDYVIDDVSGISEEVAKISPWFDNVPCNSGIDGTKLICKVIEEAPKYLEPNGTLFFPIVSFSNKDKILSKAEQVFSKVEQLSHTEFPLPTEMYKHEELLEKLKKQKHIDYKNQYGLIIFWTDIYKGDLNA